MNHFSLLDLAPIPEGGTAADALGNTIDLARLAEDSGYHRKRCLDSTFPVFA
mgnify:CR=1 FL=1